jgi:hypothetical protein
VDTNCLDISFIQDVLVVHPFVRYINIRNNEIFNKIAHFSLLIQQGLFTQTDILKLSSYAAEEYIPSLTLDTFFIDDIKVQQHKIKTSIQHKALIRLMKSNQ